MSETQQPTREAGGLHDDYRETHPAFGMIGAYHTTGGGRHLFGSDTVHRGFVTIRIRRATRARGLSNDWIHGSSELIEVLVSEHQWATFISTLNMGDGVPCTLSHIAGEGLIPGIEPVDDRRAEHRREVSDTLADAVKAIEAIRDAAPTKKLREMAEKALQEINANLDFVGRQFDEHAEETVERAKTEFEAWATQAIMRRGLQSLAGGSSVIELDSGDES